MSVRSAPLPSFRKFAALRRFTVDEYHRMADAGVLTEDDKVELIEGYIYYKFPPEKPRRRYPDLRPFTVDEYHRLISAGILTEDDKVELLDGYVVNKMARNPPHDNSILRTLKRLARLVPPGWEVRVQSAITLSDAEPEPDLAVVRGDETTYARRHPRAQDVGLLVEASESSLERDRHEKGPAYSAAHIPWYWIINLTDCCVEVYSQPAGPAEKVEYAQRQIYGVGESVPLVLDGQVVGSVPVAELMP